MSCEDFRNIERKFIKYFSNPSSTAEDLLELEKLFTDPNGYNINMTHSCYGRTNLLHMLYTNNSQHLKKKEDIAKMLIRLGININHKTNNGILPVHYLLCQMYNTENYDNIELFELMLPEIDDVYMRTINYNVCNIREYISSNNCINKVKYYFALYKKGVSIEYFKLKLNSESINILEEIITEYEFQNRSPINRMLYEYNKFNSSLLKEKQDIDNIEKTITEFENKLNQKKAEVEQDEKKLQQMNQELSKKQTEYQEKEKVISDEKRKNLVTELLKDLETNEILGLLSERFKNSESDNSAPNDPESDNSAPNDPVPNDSESNDPAPSND